MAQVVFACALLLLLAAIFGGCAVSQLPVQLPSAIACKGRAIIAVGPYAGTIDCGEGFMYQTEQGK